VKGPERSSRVLLVEKTENLVWRQRHNLKGSRYSLAEDLPPALWKMRKNDITTSNEGSTKDGGCESYDHWRPCYCERKLTKKTGVETTKAESQGLIKLMLMLFFFLSSSFLFFLQIKSL